MERKKSNKNNNFWTRHFIPNEAGYNLSWGAVIAGTITFLSVFIVLSLITSALGFGLFSPENSNPFDGVGTGTAIWTIISLLLSFLVGGFVAGLSARRTGILHGFLTWSLSVLVLVYFVASSVGAVVNKTADVAGSAVGATVDITGTAIDKTGNGFGDLMNQASEQITGINTDELETDVYDILRDTEKKELQPDYISNILEESKNEVVEAGKQLATNPQNSDEIFDNLTNSLTNKIETLSNRIDKDAIANAVEKNTELDGAEAEKTVDNIYNKLVEVSDEAKVQLQNSQEKIEELKVNANQTVEEGREKAEDVTNTISGSLVLIFVGLLIGLVVSSYGGILGSKKVKNTKIEE